MSTIAITILSVAGAIVVLLSVVLVVALIRDSRMAKAPPAPPFKCPICGSAAIEILSSGLWDGFDSVGRGTGGMFRIGTCTNCRTRAMYSSTWNPDTDKSMYTTRKITDEEWRREFEAHEKRVRIAETFPFTPDDQQD